MKDVFWKLMFNIQKNSMNSFKIGKFKKLLPDLCDKKEHVIQIRHLKQALNQFLEKP